MLRVALPVHVEGELDESAKAFLARAKRLLRALPLRQVEHESDTLIPAFLEGRRADQHGNTAAVFPEVFLLDRPQNPGHLVLLYQSRISSPPLQWCEIRPAYATCDEVLMIVPHRTEKCVAG